MTDVVIHHNPDCGTSRNVLALIGNAGLEPTIIECLKAPALGSKCTNTLSGRTAPLGKCLSEALP